MTKRTPIMRTVLALLSLLAAAPLAAQQAEESPFVSGPVFTEFGDHAPAEGMVPLPEGVSFKVAYDVSEKSEDGTINRRLATPARFINMHVAAGVPEENISLAVVVHGKAVFDLVSDEGLAARDMAPNASRAMIEEMLAHGVRFIVCGQSAAANGVKKADLIDGVDLYLSAMTAHALLQQDGYTVNPF